MREMGKSRIEEMFSCQVEAKWHRRGWHILFRKGYNNARKINARASKFLIFHKDLNRLNFIN